MQPGTGCQVSLPSRDSAENSLGDIEEERLDSNTEEDSRTGLLSSVANDSSLMNSQAAYPEAEKMSNHGQPTLLLTEQLQPKT